MTTEAGARAAVQAALGHDRPSDLVIWEVEEHARAWVVLVGASPFVVAKADGTVHRYGSSPAERARFGAWLDPRPRRDPGAPGRGLEHAVAWVEAAVGPVRVTGELVGGWTSTMLSLETATGEGLVLRLMTQEPWRTHGAALTSRESEVQRMLASTPVAAPRSVALDGGGASCGHPAHLMTRLPGSVRSGRPSRDELGWMVDVLAGIHAVVPDLEVRTYQSWAFEAKYVVPPWSTDDGLWRAAFDLLRTPPPAYDPTFLHRDFQPRNLLWTGSGDGGGVSGVVDWVETSTGPAWLDVSHGASNLAVTHDVEVAEAFLREYARRTGRERQPYLEVMDLVGFLPPPGRAGFLTLPREQLGAQAWLRRAMGLASAGHLG